MIYWCILIFLGALYPLTKVKVNTGIGVAIDGKKIYMSIATVILVLFVGFRSVDVGSDTAMYKRIFDWAVDGTSFIKEYFSWHSGAVEPLFYIITYGCAKILNFQIYLLILAIISVVPIMYIIYKYSDNAFYSLFLYISFGYFSFALSGVRQAIAIGLCMFAFDAAIENKIKKYVIILVVAVLIHKTALLFIPVYFLANIKKGKDYKFVFAVILVFVFLMRTPLYKLLNLFARQSFDLASSDQGGYRMFLVMLFTVAIGWFYYYRFISKKDDTSKDLSWLLLLMISVSALMWPIANLNAELNRMYYYYHIFIILYIPNLLKSINRKEHFLLLLMFLTIGCYYLQVYIINGQLNYYPYIPFWK